MRDGSKYPRLMIIGRAVSGFFKRSLGRAWSRCTADSPVPKQELLVSYLVYQAHAQKVYTK